MVYRGITEHKNSTPITTEEIEEAVKEIKNGRAPGPGDISKAEI